MSQYKIYMLSLGCDKNLVDSERMLGVLRARGFSLTDDPLEADAAVVNTCCFIEDAKKESIDRIFELAALKGQGRLKVLAAAGCMAQRYADEILEDIPELDAVVGTTACDSIAEVVLQALSGKRSAVFRGPDEDPGLFETGRVVTTGGHYAYLKIAEGCDKRCSYCAIPIFRGRYRSYPMEQLIDEASKLAEGGASELILVAQDTALYGVDIYGKRSLHTLLEKLCAIEGIKWIRLLYCYPEEIYDDLISVMAREPRICHYLDMPLQHASDDVLRSMNRGTTSEKIRERIKKIREAIPDIALRTTLISGFPGESDEDHAKALAFVKEMRFDRLGVFTYSREEGTPAYDMKPQVPKSTARARQAEIMGAQQRISLENNRRRIGSTLTVFVEGKLPEDGVYIGRSYADAPEVDGFVFFSSERDIMSGSFVEVRILEASEYDLHGEEIVS